MLPPRGSFFKNRIQNHLRGKSFLDKYQALLSHLGNERKPSILSEEFSMLAAWKISLNRATLFTI
jgi:hypothetical protein